MLLNIAALPDGLSSGLSAVCPRFSDWDLTVKLSYGTGILFSEVPPSSPRTVGPGTDPTEPGGRQVGSRVGLERASTCRPEHDSELSPQDQSL